jgi:hypothetical protein
MIVFAGTEDRAGFHEKIRGHSDFSEGVFMVLKANLVIALLSFIILTIGCGDASGSNAPVVVPDQQAGSSATSGSNAVDAAAGSGGYSMPNTGGFTGIVAADSGTAGTGAAGIVAAGSGGAGTGAAAGTGPTGGSIDAGQLDGNVSSAGNGAAGTAGAAGTTNPDIGPNQTLPPVTDYAAAGPFQTITVNNTGPDGQYTMFRPTTLGENGFLHPPLTWGNGITTTPAIYPVLLSTVASHGFVVIASNSTAVGAAQLTAGLDWLIQLNDDPSSEFYQKLDPNRAITMGYSLGGGAALSSAAHPNVIATIAMHPAPGGGAHAPVLLFTGTADTIVAPSMVDMSYNMLNVPTFYTSLSGATHMEPILTGGRELAPSIAWLRMHAYNDDGARVFFYGTDCTLCVAPWTCKTKNWQ